MEYNSPPNTTGWTDNSTAAPGPTWAMWFENVWRATRVPPIFSAYQSAAQTVGVGTTKLQFQTKEFDTLVAFDATTNYRYTPTREGYYQFNGSAQLNVSGVVYLQLFKNGVAARTGNATGVSGTNPVSTISTIVYMNGTTDYVELDIVSDTGGTLTASAATTYFQGCLVSRG